MHNNVIKLKVHVVLVLHYPFLYSVRYNCIRLVGNPFLLLVTDKDPLGTHKCQCTVLSQSLQKIKKKKNYIMPPCHIHVQDFPSKIFEP